MAGILYGQALKDDGAEYLPATLSHRLSIGIVLTDRIHLRCAFLECLLIPVPAGHDIAGRVELHILHNARRQKGGGDGAILRRRFAPDFTFG